MAIETLAASALGYLVSAIQKSKGGQKAAEEMSSAIWEWVRPIFLIDDQPLNDLKDEPQDKDNQSEVEIKIKKHLKKHPEQHESLKTILDQLMASEGEPAKSITQNHYGTGDNVGGDKIVNG